MEYNKLKIKTITCHDVVNFGATLQAYALMKYLQQSGHDVQIINYKPEYLSYNLWTIGSRWNRNLIIKIIYFLYVIPKRLLMGVRRKKFDKFNNTFLNLTQNKYKSVTDLKADPPEADIYFAGSDQIWNPLLPNGKDPSFYLDFAPDDAIRASYAASFSVSEIPHDLKDFVEDQLRKMDYISVRESSGIELLENLNIKAAEVVVDPVFLLDKQHWTSLARFGSKEKYIFVYDQENNKKIREVARDLSRKYNLKIYAIESLYPMGYAHERIKDAGPEEFLGLIMNSEVCLTNSFHCMSFSIIFEKKFYLFKRNHLKVNSRMIDLLKYLDLNSRIISDDARIDLVADNIKYDEVIPKVTKRIKSSQDYINRILSKSSKHVS